MQKPYNGKPIHVLFTGLVRRYTAGMKISAHRAALLFKFGSIVLALATIALWLGSGAHPGWTQTSVVELRLDEITGIEYPVRHDTFIAGVEVLGSGLGLALLSAALGFIIAGRIRRRNALSSRS